MRKCLLIIGMLFLCSCASQENKEAIACIENNTCNMNSNNKWIEIDELVYSLEIQGVNYDRNVIIVDFNQKYIQNTYYYNEIEEGVSNEGISLKYDWGNDKGYYINPEKGVIAINGKNQTKILEETTYNDKKIKASMVWDDIKVGVISPFRKTPLYPLDLE